MYSMNNDYNNNNDEIQSLEQQSKSKLLDWLFFLFVSLQDKGSTNKHKQRTIVTAAASKQNWRHHLSWKQYHWKQI